MAAQTGKFVDEARLMPRDNSGGPKGPHGIAGSDFGDGGKPVGGEPANNRGDAEDEIVMRSGGGARRSEKSGRMRGGGGY